VFILRAVVGMGILEAFDAVCSNRQQTSPNFPRTVDIVCKIHMPVSHTVSSANM
jgi:hypothetical protein